jgi:uncharacterized membrane protein
MNATGPSQSQRSVKPTDQLLGFLHWLTSGLALAGFALVLATLLFEIELPGKPGWAEALLIFLAALTTLVSLARQLPAQNVLLSASIIALIGSVAHGVGAATAIPFGPFNYSDAAGPRVLEKLAWPIPLLWVVVILNSRGVARLILRPWRKLGSYGFWLIGITTALTVLFDAGLEPFAAVVKKYWFWHPTRLPVTWGTAPITNFVGWLVTALLILAFATPALIDKRARSSNRPPNYHPLGAWLLAMVLFGTGAATHQLWLGAGYCTVAGIAVSAFAIRGARW